MSTKKKNELKDQMFCVRLSKAQMDAIDFVAGCFTISRSEVMRICVDKVAVKEHRKAQRAIKKQAETDHGS